MKIPEIKLRYWMGRGELAKLARVLRNYWEHVKAAFEMPLQQHDPLTAPIALVNILAWQRDIERLEKEPEDIYRIRVAYAFEFAQCAGDVDGFHRMFERLGIDWLVIHERQDPANWDIVTIETKDSDLSQKTWLMNALIEHYGRTCRRYRFQVTYPETANWHGAMFGNAFSLHSASAMDQVTIAARKQSIEHKQQVFIASLESKK